VRGWARCWSANVQRTSSLRAARLDGVALADSTAAQGGEGVRGGAQGRRGVQRCGAASIDAAWRNSAGLWPCTGQRGAAAGGAGCSGAWRRKTTGWGVGPARQLHGGGEKGKRRAAAADRAGPGGEEGKKRGEKERGGPTGLVLAYAEVSPFSFFSKTNQSFKFILKLFKDIWNLNKFDLAFFTWFCLLFLQKFLFIHKDILCTKHEKIQIKPNEIYSNCLDAFHFISVHFIFGL